MTLFLVCVKIFFARILDVSIATLRQSVMLNGKVFVSSVLAFIEVFIWFIVAREALRMDVNSILIPIFYSLGYATGTLLGSFLARLLISNSVSLQVIVDNEMLWKALKVRGYEVSMLDIKCSNNKVKQMLFLEINRKSLKKVEALVKKISPDAFFIVNDTRKVMNGVVK